MHGRNNRNMASISYLYETAIRILNKSTYLWLETMRDKSVAIFAIWSLTTSGMKFR